MTYLAQARAMQSCRHRFRGGDREWASNKRQRTYLQAALGSPPIVEKECPVAFFRPRHAAAGDARMRGRLIATA